VSGQQGHARFLVGVRISAPARVRVQVTTSPGNAPVKTVVSSEAHAAGRVYVLLEATNEQRFQLPAGTYGVAVSATDSQNRSSTTLKSTFTLKLTPPRGRLDIYTIPLWPSIARQGRLPAGGVFVAALAPRGSAVTAGMLRGDVITAVNNRRLTGPGLFQSVLRTLPAEAPVPVEVRRGTQTLTLNIALKPDWEAAPDYAAALRVITRREPTVLAYAFAQARQLIDTGKADDARTLIDAWRPAWRNTAAYHLLNGDILYAQGDQKGALGAFNRASKADAKMAAARFGQGLALAALDRSPEAARAFAAAAAADPTDAVAQAFRAYLLVRTDAFPQALDAANRAVALDRNYEDGHIARALALFGQTRTADGVAALKRGLLLLADPRRAASLIAKNLEPNEP
jgi:predicted Zn-dependent protease